MTAKKDQKTLGWTVGDGSGHEGYCVEDYFDAAGNYLGPDEHGIEPIFNPQVDAEVTESRMGNNPFGGKDNRGAPRSNRGDGPTIRIV